MEITLINLPSPFLINDSVFPPLGIMNLSSSLKQEGISAQCLDFSLGSTILDIQSNIVGISFTSSQKEEAFKIADSLRKDKILIAGGPHPTHVPQECVKHFDYVVQGEADYTLPILLKRLRLGLNSDTIIPPILVDIESIPFPDRDALPISSYTYLLNNEKATPLMTSRSCPYKCSYCGKLNNDYRAYSAQRTVDEIKYIHQRYGFSAFMIFDDTFIINQKRLEEIVYLLKGESFIFRCFGRANLLISEVCHLLKKMNVVEVGVGIESGSDTVLQINMKGTSRDQNFQAVANLHAAGIRVKAFIIVGLPGETEETVNETRSWIDIAKPDDFDFSVFQPMPGSEVYKNPEKYKITIESKLCGTWYKGRPGSYISVSRTKELSADRIVQLRDELEHTYKKGFEECHF